MTLAICPKCEKPLLRLDIEKVGVSPPLVRPSIYIYVLSCSKCNTAIGTQSLASLDAQLNE